MPPARCGPIPLSFPISPIICARAAITPHSRCCSTASPTAQPSSTPPCADRLARARCAARRRGCDRPRRRLRDGATYTIGGGTIIGDGACLQGRHDGRCIIGERTWIGPQAFIDGRDLEIGDDVGIGPGVRIIGSDHTGLPED